MGSTSLVGRVALVTGGGTGIGAGIARALAEAGAAVVLGQRRSELAQQYAAELEAEGFAAAGTGMDVRDRAQVRAAVTLAVERFGRLDILVNNAAITGTPAVQLFLETTDAHLDLVLDVNLRGRLRVRSGSRPRYGRARSGRGDRSYFVGRLVRWARRSHGVLRHQGRIDRV